MKRRNKTHRNFERKPATRDEGGKLDVTESVQVEEADDSRPFSRTARIAKQRRVKE